MMALTITLPKHSTRESKVLTIFFWNQRDLPHSLQVMKKVLLAIFYSFPDDYKISGRPGSVEEECDNKLPRRVLATADAR